MAPNESPNVQLISAGNSLFEYYNANTEVICDGRFITYGGHVVSQRNVIFDKSKTTATAHGGEDIMAILNKYKDSDEIYKLQPNAFQQPCNTPNPMRPKLIGSPLYLSDWLKATQFITANTSVLKNDITHYNNFTIAITRYEYANLYWTIMDIYDVFLVMKLFNKTPSETSILIIDAHPKSHLDPLWNYMFGSIHRLADIDNKVQYDHLVWGMSRGNSPLLVKTKTPPLVREFRETLWSRVGIRLNEQQSAQCSPNATLNIVFIWRHNYIAHPRNPSGEISRKIANEEELLEGIKKRYPYSNVIGVQLDNFSIQQQVSLISQADIMIGMHGAAFAYALLMSNSSVVIEMFPRKFASNWHMEYLAKWNGLKYITWKNSNIKLEDVRRKMTTIPLGIAEELIGDAKNYICSRPKR